MSHVFVRSLLSLLLLLPFAACGGDPDEGSGATAGQGDGNEKPEYGGIFRMNVLRGDPNGLDPVVVDSKHADDIASQIFDKLVDLDDSLNLVPELAKSWEASEDGTSYTFHLRTDVHFQDHEAFEGGVGRRMTAEDVRYSLTRCCDPRHRTKAFWGFKGKVRGADEYYRAAGSDSPLDGVEGFVVVNDSTFRIDLVQPYAPFLFILVNSLGSVVPREAVEMYGIDFARNPVGTGPFQFAYWKEGQEILLTRNEKYWESDAEGNQLPYLDTVAVSVMTDDNTQFQSFVGGNLDELFNIPTAQYETVIETESMTLKEEYARFQLHTAPAMLTWYFGFNNMMAPFDDANVRRAFNHAIDRASIVRFTLNNSPYAPATNGLTPPVFPDYDAEKIEGYDLDVERAQEFLAAAGYPKGEGFPDIELHIYNEPRLVEVSEAIQAQLLQNLNLDVQIRPMAFPQLIDLAESGTIEFWGTRWYGDYPDPETYLNLLNGQVVPEDPKAPSNPNSSRYDSPEYNELFNQAVGTVDDALRMAKYLEAEQVAIDDAPILPLFYERHYRLLQPHVRGIGLGPMARYNLKRVWLVGGRGATGDA